MSTTHQICTFFVEDELFGVPVEDVQEIILEQETTRIPLAPPSVAGLINLRGQIVPIVDLRYCLELGPRATDNASANVVLATADGAVSLRVDDVGDVVDVDESALEGTPQHMRGATRKLIEGVYKLPKQLLLLLSTEAVINAAVSGAVTHAPVDMVSEVSR